MLPATLPPNSESLNERADGSLPHVFAVVSDTVSRISPVFAAAATELLLTSPPSYRRSRLTQHWLENCHSGSGNALGAYETKPVRNPSGYCVCVYDMRYLGPYTKPSSSVNWS